MAHVVGVGLEGEPEQGDGLAPEGAEVLLELADDSPLLKLVHLDDGGEQLEVVARVPRELLQRRDVFGQAVSRVAEARAQEVRPDAAVVAHPCRYLVDVGARRLADVRNLVDERDLGGEKRVGRVLDHLGRGHIRAHDRSAERLVERRQRIAVSGVEGADHDPVGLHEVPDRGALAQELGVRHIPDRPKTAGIELGARLQPGADRDGALHDEQQGVERSRELVEEPPHGRKVRVPRVGGRRAHADECDVGAREQVLGGVGEVEAVAIPREQLGKAGLVEGRLAALEHRDSFVVDVSNPDVMAPFGEARGRDETDPAGAENAQRRRAHSPADRRAATIRSII